MSDSVTPWTAAYQTPPFMGFSRQEYWSGVPLPSPRTENGHYCVSMKRNWVLPWSSKYYAVFWENAMAPQSSTVARKIPWMEEPGRLQSMAKSQERLSDFTFTFHFHALEKEMATHSSVLAWRIPGTGEPGGPPSMGSHRVRHDRSNLATVAAVIIHLKPDILECEVNWALGSITMNKASGGDRIPVELFQS